MTGGIERFWKVLVIRSFCCPGPKRLYMCTTPLFPGRVEIERFSALEGAGTEAASLCGHAALHACVLVAAKAAAAPEVSCKESNDGKNADTGGGGDDDDSEGKP